MHKFRESWRRSLFEQFLSQNRWDSNLLRGQVVYDSKSCKLAIGLCMKAMATTAELCLLVQRCPRQFIAGFEGSKFLCTARGASKRGQQIGIILSGIVQGFKALDLLVCLEPLWLAVCAGHHDPGLYGMRRSSCTIWLRCGSR